MRLQRIVCVLAAVGAVALSFTPYLDAPVDARSLSEFAPDQPPAFWFGRTAVLLLVITAAASFRSLRLAAACAVIAVAAAAVPAMVPGSRRLAVEGWTSYAGASSSPYQPAIDVSSMWAVSGLMTAASVTAAILILSLTRSDDGRRAGRVTLVGLLTLVASATSLAISAPKAPHSLGGPRRYADYLPFSSGSTPISGPDLSVSNAWFAAAGVALVLLAAAAARARRPLSASRRRRSN